MTKKNNSFWGWVLGSGTIAFCFGIGILFLLNNFTTAGVYEAVSCTFNQHDCYFNASCPDCPDWNGICTNEIENECCTPIRMCSGQIVENYWECLDKYCPNENMQCAPGPQIQGGYKCACEEILP